MMVHVLKEEERFETPECEEKLVKWYRNASLCNVEILEKVGNEFIVLSSDAVRGDGVQPGNVARSLLGPSAATMRRSEREYRRPRVC